MKPIFSASFIKSKVERSCCKLLNLSIPVNHLKLKDRFQGALSDSPIFSKNKIKLSRLIRKNTSSNLKLL